MVNCTIYVFDVIYDEEDEVRYVSVSAVGLDDAHKKLREKMVRCYQRDKGYDVISWRTI